VAENPHGAAPGAASRGAAVPRQRASPAPGASGDGEPAPSGASREDGASHDVLSFSRFLALEAEREDGLAKGERTRRRIKAATARILETKGYHAMQMADIARSAGLSHGAVYKYFENKKHVTLEVLSECVRWSMRQMLPDKLESDAYQRIYQATLEQVRLFVANVGLIRCIRQLGDELPEFNDLVLRTNGEWCDLVARGFERRWRPGRAKAQLACDVAHALGAMVDELMYDIFVRGNPRLAHYRDDPERLARLISILWYRAAYGRDPESTALDGDDPLLTLTHPAGRPDARSDPGAGEREEET
jgi:AcrR family transcriptional regulator